MVLLINYLGKPSVYFIIVKITLVQNTEQNENTAKLKRN